MKQRKEVIRGRSLVYTEHPLPAQKALVPFYLRL